MTLKKYRVWTHFDTGVGQTIEARDEDEAIRKAGESMEREDFSEQIKDNLVMGETNIVREINATKVKPKN